MSEFLWLLQYFQHCTLPGADLALDIGPIALEPIWYEDGSICNLFRLGVVSYVYFVVPVKSTAPDSSLVGIVSVTVVNTGSDDTGSSNSCVTAGERIGADGTSGGGGWCAWVTTVVSLAVACCAREPGGADLGGTSDVGGRMGTVGCWETNVVCW